LKLALLTSHPIQYQAPWFRFLAENGFSGLRVFYLWDGGVSSRFDPGFGRTVKWDIPLLEGYEFEFVPNRARRPGTDTRFGLNNPELGPRLANFGPDAVLFLGYNYLSYYRVLFSRLHRMVPLLFRGDSHRLVPEHGLRSGLRRQWIRFVFRRFAAFLFVGLANKDYFRLHGIPEARLFFSPHSVDNQRFFAQAETAVRQAADWRASLGISPAELVVLFAGKFERKKRPRDLAAAFRRADLPGTRLLMVGSGEEENELRADAAGGPRILFAPFQNQTEMPRTYAAADLFVLPSFGRGETWGLAVNEAMCLGRPIIVSSHVGCAQDLVQSGRNGLVFPAGDIPALVGALRDAFSDPVRLKTWGAASREIIQNYSYDEATRGLRQALDSLNHRKQDTNH
jgi:glycosyltransferase involved in cell wall biosynthesis